MAKVKTNFGIIDKIKGLEKSSGATKKLGTAIEKTMKDHISKGISPVKGERKFASYAVDRDGDPKKYPTGYKKGKKPINLYLSGKMLSYLTHWTKRKKNSLSLIIGIHPNAPGDVVDRAEAHNDGTLVKNNVPKRKFIPNKQGDKFNVTITRLIKNLLSDEINKTIKKSNKKS